MMSIPSNLRAENEVVLFPSPACREPDGSGWRVSVQGDVYTRGRPGLTKRFLLKVLQRLMRASDEVIRGAEFQKRIERFVARDEGGKRVAVRVSDEVFPLPGKTQSNGHFSACLRLSNELVDRCRIVGTTGGADRLPLEVCREGEPERSEGQVFLLEPTGVSVISDIDDTIKLSHVGCKRTLLQNTFLKEFEVIEGMASVYQRWAAAGADFHYVSSSPWQLYDHLRDLFERTEFPAGTYHLRAFRLRDHFLRRILLLRRSNKASAIASLLRTFPQRKFYLIGDSGESDPETYGAVARRFPRQTAGIFIRPVGPKATTRRFETAFRQLPPDLWRIFETADELPSDLHGGPPKRAK